MTIHKLKTWEPYWNAIACGYKNFEVRRDDKGFQKGDVVELIRCDKTPYGTWEVKTDYHGKPAHVITKQISYILTGGQFGIEPGYVVMALQDVLPKAE